MSQSQMQNFNKYFMPATIETLEQKVELFNAASGGAITLTTQGFNGDFLQNSFFAAIHSAQRRVDRYATNASVAPTDLTQLKESGVKVAGGFGPIRYEPSQMSWLNHPTKTGVEVASRNFAEAMLKDQLNTAIAAAVAAIGNQAAAVNDVSASTGLSYAAINGGHSKYGDASSLLTTDVMSGAALHALIGQNIQNPAQLFAAGNVRIVDILGKLIVVTDAPALFEAGTPGKHKVLSLSSQGIVVYDGSDVNSNIQTSNGKERIETTMQVDYTFGLSLKGYSWDEANGGKSPTNAKLETGTNWLKVATDIKHTAGALTIAQAA